MKFIPILCAVACAIPLAGCASSWQGIPHNAFVAGDVSPEAVMRSRNATPHCEQAANETTPSTGKIARTDVINGFTGGLIGGSGSTAAQLAIMANPISGAAVAAGGFGYGIAAAGVGAARAKDTHDNLAWHGAEGCLQLEAQGVHTVSPSEQDALLGTHMLTHGNGSGGPMPGGNRSWEDSPHDNHSSEDRHN